MRLLTIKLNPSNRATASADKAAASFMKIGSKDNQKSFMLTVILFLLLNLTSGANAQEKNILKVGFTAVVLKENLELNKLFAEYLEKKSGIKTSLIYRKSYKEIDDLLESRELELAWICGAPYVTDREKFGLELLAIPEIKGKPTYYSLVVVPVNSPAKTLLDLKGKRYAFSDPLSNSGKVCPTYVLARKGEKPETFFKKYIYTYAHYESIQAVAEQFVDGASVDSYVYEAARRFNPGMVSKTKVIEKFGPHGFTPLVIRKELSPELKKRLQDILTGMAKDVKGKEILRAYGFDSFVVPSDNLYNSIREMMNFIGIYP